MKTTRSTNWINIALLGLAVAFIVTLLTIPLLAKGISHIVGDLIGPEKLDIRPIPIPVPPPPLAGNEAPVSATPRSSPLAMGMAPQAIPVPTPPTSSTASAHLFAEREMHKLSGSVTVEIVSTPGILVLTLMLSLLVIWLHRTVSSVSLNKENAC